MCIRTISCQEASPTKGIPGNNSCSNRSSSQFDSNLKESEAESNKMEQQGGGASVGGTSSRKLLRMSDKNSNKEKLIVLDLHKIKHKLYDRFSTVYQQVCNDVDRVHLADHDNAEKKPDDNNVTEKAIAGKNNSGKNKEEEVTKQLAYSIFEANLRSKGFKVNPSSWFIAEGGFGVVLRVQRGGTKYACKVISNVLFRLRSDKSNLTTVKMRSRFANEVEIMRRVASHPNVIDFVDYFELDADHNETALDTQVKKQAQIPSGPASPPESKLASSKQWNEEIRFKTCYLVMEYASGKTLSSYIKNRRRLAEDTTKAIFREVVSAVHFLHHCHVAHRDIKLSNLLLQKKAPSSGSRLHFAVKLCDFGLSSQVDPSDPEASFFMKPVGTSIYMSPEILRAYYFYNTKQLDLMSPYCAFAGDIWALGVCLFYCLHGYYPLDVLTHGSKTDRMAVLAKIFEDRGSTATDSLEEENEARVNQVIHQRVRLLLKNYHHKLAFNCKDLLGKILEVEPDKRATIDTVSKHQYFG